MIVPVILDAFLGILFVKIEFSNDLFEEFILNWHLFFARKHSLVSKLILYLKRPSVVPDVIYRESCLWVSVKNSSYHVLTLT